MPGGNWIFQGPVFLNHQTKSSYMKKVLALMVMVPLLYGAKPQTGKGNSYRYYYKLTAPRHSESLVFDDSTVRFQFYINECHIIFVLRNYLDKRIIVNWNDGIITQYRNDSRLIHGPIKYADREKSMEPTIIEPGGSLTDLVVPLPNVAKHAAGRITRADWEAEVLFPIFDNNKPKQAQAIMANVGEELSVYLPIEIENGKKLGYRFTFQVKDIACITCKNDKEQ